MQVIVANVNFALTSKNLEEKALRSSAVYPEHRRRRGGAEGAEAPPIFFDASLVRICHLVSSKAK